MYVVACHVFGYFCRAATGLTTASPTLRIRNGNDGRWLCALPFRFTSTLAELLLAYRPALLQKKTEHFHAISIFLSHVKICSE